MEDGKLTDMQDAERLRDVQMTNCKCNLEGIKGKEDGARLTSPVLKDSTQRGQVVLKDAVCRRVHGEDT